MTIELECTLEVKLEDFDRRSDIDQFDEMIMVAIHDAGELNLFERKMLSARLLDLADEHKVSFDVAFGLIGRAIMHLEYARLKAGAEADFG